MLGVAREAADILFRIKPREPVSADNQLLNLPNVVVSSHKAGVTVETGRAMGMQVTAEMLRVIRGEKPHVLGNPDLWPKLAHLK